MLPKNQIETMENDAFSASSDAQLSALEESTDITQQITADVGDVDEESVSPAPDSDSSNGLSSPGGSVQASLPTFDDGFRRVDGANGGQDLVLDDEDKSFNNSTDSTISSGIELDNMRDSVMQAECEPPNQSGATEAAWATPTIVSEFPPTRIHPFDMPCPLQVSDRIKVVSDECTATTPTVGAHGHAHSVQNDSERSRRSEPVLKKEAAQHQNNPTQKMQSNLYSSMVGADDDSLRSSRSSMEASKMTNCTTKSGAETDLKEVSEFDLESQSDADDLKAAKFGSPSARALLIEDEEEDESDEDAALRPPELMRQDAASGLVWSVSQPGAFREGGTADEVEEEHDDWMMATRVSETPTTVDDSHIIVHAAAVVTEHVGQHEGDQELQQQVSSFVFMGGEVDAVEVCPDAQSPRSASWEASPPKQLRRVYAAFICAIFIAITVTVFVTVEIVESSSSPASRPPPEYWPSPSPLGTAAPTTEELLVRSYAKNESTFPKPNSIVSSQEDFVWQPLGHGLDGEFANQTMGFSISLSAVGWILAVGSPWANDVFQAGSVSVYHLGDHAEWSLVGNIIPGITDGERFGWSVDISDSGDILAASCTGGKGRLSMYKFDPRNKLWDKMGNDLVGDYDGQNFGFSISLSGIGTIVATGNPGVANDTGHVAVYKFNGIDWELMGSRINGLYGGQRFGGSVSLSLDGQTLAIGTIEHRCRRHVPHVRVYQWNSTDWELMGRPINGTSALDQCAVSVALSADGTTVAAGAYLSSNDDNRTEMTGNVLVFRWNIDQWEQLGSTIAGEMERGNFGISVAMSLDGNFLVAGANLGGKNGAGRVRVFHFNQTVSEWQHHGWTINGESFDQFGKSVAMSPGGRVIAAGAYMHSEPGLEDSGQVRVYKSF